MFISPVELYAISPQACLLIPSGVVTVSEACWLSAEEVWLPCVCLLAVLLLCWNAETSLKRESSVSEALSILVKSSRNNSRQFSPWQPGRVPEDTSQSTSSSQGPSLNNVLISSLPSTL